MLSTDQRVYSAGKNDECYTPEYAVAPILEYIPTNAIVWCPFDTEESAFVKQISTRNKVTFSHINSGQDFFSYEPERWDVMISNPPFTKKRQIFERALSFNKPFALIMTNIWLNDSAPAKLFNAKELQLLMFDKRINFCADKTQIPFSVSYYCWNLLPKQIIFKELRVNPEYFRKWVAERPGYQAEVQRKYRERQRLKLGL